MPEEEARERKRGFTLGQVAAVVIVVGAVEALVLGFVLRPNPAVTAAPPSPAASAAQEEELRAPTLPLRDVAVTVPVDQTGEHTRTLVMSVQLKLGREVGKDGRLKEEKLDLDYLTNVYVPKVRGLLPWARGELIGIVAESGYADLHKPQSQREIMEKLRKRINERLREYGVEPRVVEIWCEQFIFD